VSETDRIRRFWNARAREDAFYFVDNRLEYGNPDLERFWAEGERDLDRLLGPLGAELRPGDTAVDIGCGVGRLTRWLAKRAARVYAVDVSEEMLARARELNAGLENVRWLHGDGSSLTGVPDGGADACVSHVVFQHLPDPRITLGYVQEMGRALSPGGWSAFQVSTDVDVHRDRPEPGLASRVRQLVRREPRGLAHPAWLGSAVSLDELREVAGASGLRVERVVGAGSQFTLVLLRRMAVP
jgi:SAM-dependent methyltransferase